MSQDYSGTIHCDSYILLVRVSFDMLFVIRYEMIPLV